MLIPRRHGVVVPVGDTAGPDGFTSLEMATTLAEAPLEAQAKYLPWVRSTAESHQVREA